MNKQDSELFLFSPQRYEPVTSLSDAVTAHKKSDISAVKNWLLSEQPVVISDAYPTGLFILNELKKEIFGPRRKPNVDYSS
ncbi:hypothetical protein QLX67_13885, partial [Balneolaceae bacterium ANBcel3]|nr:hypothetical protein [Balneolaceae bacterium ANBcel3]